MNAKFDNQKKLSSDNSILIGVEGAGSLYHSLSKMDILYWKNAIEIDIPKSDIVDQCEFSYLNI